MIWWMRIFWRDALRELKIELETKLFECNKRTIYKQNVKINCHVTTYKSVVCAPTARFVQLVCFFFDRRRYWAACTIRLIFFPISCMSLFRDTPASLSSRIKLGDPAAMTSSIGRFSSSSGNKLVVRDNNELIRIFSLVCQLPNAIRSIPAPNSLFLCKSFTIVRYISLPCLSRAWVELQHYCWTTTFSVNRPIKILQVFQPIKAANFE